VSEKLRSTGSSGREGYANVTWRNSTTPRTLAGSSTTGGLPLGVRTLAGASGQLSMVGTRSSSAKMRAAAARDLDMDVRLGTAALVVVQVGG